MSASGFNPFAAGVIARVAPSTAPQREVIASSQLSDEANTGFNEAVSVTFQGAIDPQVLIASFDALIARHEAFHVTFSRKGDEICLQEDIRAKLEYIDLRQRSAVDQQQYQKTLAKNIAISPMNLEEGPLVFAWLLQLGDEARGQYQLFIAAHHVICDGWTFGLMLKELAEIYNAGGNDSALSAAPSFLDFAEQQDVGQIANTDIDYWQQKFASQPPNLDLPLDYYRPSQRPFAAARYDYRIGETLAQSLRQTSAKLKSSLVNTVLAAYFTLLHRLSGNEDIVVGLPVAGQAALNQLQMAGHMVQLLPIRVQMAADTAFDALLAQIQSEVLAASEHADFTFGTLVQNTKLDRSRVPLISTIFNIDQAMPPLQFGDTVGSVVALPRAAENFELFLNIVPSDGALLIEATYSTALFSESSVRSWLSALELILTQVVSDPTSALGQFALTHSLPDFAVALNATQVDIVNTSLSAAFARSLARFPNQPAVVAGATHLSYQQLDSEVKLLALALQKLGVSVGDVVGICCGRSEQLLLAVLAIHHVGAAYLPLEPGFPKERLVYMVEDSAAALIIGDAHGQRAFAQSDVAWQDMAALRQSALEFADIDKCSEAAPSDLQALIPAQTLAADQLAYIIYTSGSTGKPKGVKVAHGAMINFLESMAHKPGMSAQQSLLAVTTLAFDISILELFLPLVVGGCTVIAAEQDLKEGASLAALIDTHSIGVMQATPATWRLLLASAWRDQALNQRSLTALCGGEPLPRDLADMLLPRVAALWNMFGPTETTVWSTCQQVTSLDKPITIGSPIANTQVFILDEQQRPLPACVPGELYIGGHGVALGYQHREDLTAERFVQHPQWGNIYRTGDLAKWSADGELQHLGRLDDQVKLRGYRIELGEIEHAIVNTGLVKQVAVYLWQVSDLDTRIVACCVANTKASTGGTLETTELRKQLRRILPPYMVPQYFLSIDALPLTPNGKVDKRALPQPEVTESSAILSGGSLENDTEKMLAVIWFGVIQPARALGREDNFFDVGGHSLLALEAIRQIENQTGVTLTMADLIQSRLASLAEIIDSSTAAQQVTATQAIALSAQSERRLSPDQARCLDLQLRDASINYYNLPAAWQLEGSLDVDSFLRAYHRVIEHQTALRTCIVPQDAGEFRLSLLHSDDVEWIHYRDLSTEVDGFAQAKAEIDQLAAEPFQLIAKPLLRARLYKINDQQFLFFICPNQLIFDGWSFDLLLKEMELCYLSASCDQSARLDHLALEYRDYCEWMAGRDDDKHLAEIKGFHQQALADALVLTADAVAAAQQVDRLTCHLSQQEFSRLNVFCDHQSLRLYEVLLAAFTDVMASEFHLPAFSLALPVTGRYNASVINLVGGFVSMLPFSVSADQPRDFARHCHSVAAELKAFHQKQDLSFAELVAGTEYHTKPISALISASFAFQDIRNRPRAFADVSLNQLDIDRGQLELPLEFWARVQPDGVLLVADINENLIEPAQAARILEQVCRRLNQLDQPNEQGYAEQTGQPHAKAAKSKKTLWRKLFG